jgi:hypothetical protein
MRRDYTPALVPLAFYLWSLGRCHSPQSHAIPTPMKPTRTAAGSARGRGFDKQGTGLPGYAPCGATSQPRSDEGHFVAAGKGNCAERGPGAEPTSGAQ